MSYEDFIEKTSSGFAASDLASATTEPDDAPCSACHNVGDGGFFANTDPTIMFQGTIQFPYILMWATQTIGPSGQCNGFTPSNVIVTNGQQQCLPQHPCHPTYTLDPGLIGAIDTFVSRSIARWQSGTCSMTGAADGGKE
jgi:hypothetical protein